MLSVNLNVGVYGKMVLQLWDFVGVAGCLGGTRLPSGWIDIATAN